TSVRFPSTLSDTFTISAWTSCSVTKFCWAETVLASKPTATHTNAVAMKPSAVRRFMRSPYYCAAGRHAGVCREWCEILDAAEAEVHPNFAAPRSVRDFRLC